MNYWKNSNSVVNPRSVRRMMIKSHRRSYLLFSADIGLMRIFASHTHEYIAIFRWDLT
jgi:hypothetical protein